MKAIRSLISHSASTLVMLSLSLASSAFAANQYVLTKSVSTQDFGNNGTIDHTTTVKNQYDKDAVLLSTVITQSPGGGQTTTYSYDADGNLATSDIAVDFDGDGVTDLTATTTFSYDAVTGRRTGSHQDVDDDMDGLVDIHREQTLGYDLAGNLISIVTESDVATPAGVFDGVPDQIISVSNTWVGGQLVSTTTTNDTNGDHALDDNGDSSETRTNYFDAQGRLDHITVLGWRILNNVQAPFSSMTTYTYDQHDNLVGAITQFDEGNNGTIDQVNTTTNSWKKK